MDITAEQQAFLLFWFCLIVKVIKKLVIGQKNPAQQVSPIGQVIKIQILLYCQVPSAEVPVQSLVTF